MGILEYIGDNKLKSADISLGDADVIYSSALFFKRFGNTVYEGTLDGE